MLHELDMEMERRKLRFVRYADDFSIYSKTENEARKIGNSIFLYLRDKLKLPVNREKSGIRRPLTFNILGYGFVPTYRTACLELAFGRWLRNRIRYCIRIPKLLGEETRAKAEKSDKAWSRPGSCLSMESEQKRRVGNSPKSNSEHYHNGSKTDPTRL